MIEYYNDDITLYQLFRDVFIAASITCFLWAAHRTGNGLMLGGRVKAFETLSEAYTPEEREVLIHRIKNSSMRY